MASTANEHGGYSAKVGSSRDTALFVSAFFDELHQAGVQNVVISPGSRSTPLAMVAYTSPLNCYVDIDERGAAFFAVGLAKATGRPACVICTSGTALANYYPAVMEAQTSRVPLIVLSGDRPQFLQEVGAPQTCDQLKAFSNHVRAFWQMPEAVASPERIAYVRQIAKDVYAASGARTNTGAPVHVNFPFDEPLKPDLDVPGLFSIGRCGMHKRAIQDEPYEAGAHPCASHLFPTVMKPDETLEGLAALRMVHFLQQHKVAVVCGEQTLGCDVAGITASKAGSPAEEAAAKRQLLYDFAQAFDAPLLADPLSLLRSGTHECLIDNYDNIVNRSDCPSFDVVIRFGRWPISKRLTKTIEATKPFQIVVDPVQTRDFTSSTAVFIKMEPLAFVRSLLVALNNNRETLGANDNEALGANDSINGATARSTDYLAAWALLNEQEKSRILVAHTQPNAQVEGSYVMELIDALPAYSLLFSGNSMAVRAVDTFYLKQQKPLAVLANRGLNGIDGTLSSAFGAAQAFDQTVCLVGDLTFLHDVNALALQHEMHLRAEEGHERPNIVVVVMNNKGGAIFDMLPQRENNPYFKRLFLTPQKFDIEQITQGFFVPYAHVEGIVQFREALDAFMGQPGIHVIEIALPLEGVRERYAPYQ